MGENKIYDSLTEQALVCSYRVISRYIDFQEGRFSSIYRHIYLLYKKIKDRKIICAARKMAASGTLVVDIGANIGFFSINVSKFSDITVLSFEADPVNYRQLLIVAEAEIRVKKIFPYLLAISSATGKTKLYLSELAPTDHKLINTRSSRHIEIDAMRLDDFFENHADYNRPISLIKIDVQGAELMVLSGMKKTLKDHGYPPILLEYSPEELRAAGSDPSDFFSEFHSLGYRVHLLDRQETKPDTLLKSNIIYTNLIMIHEKNKKVLGKDCAARNA